MSALFLPLREWRSQSTGTILGMVVITIFSYLFAYNYIQGISTSDVPITINATFTQREFMPLCSAEPLLILTVHLASIPTPGLPPNLVYSHLYTYLPGNIVHFLIPFDLSASEGLASYVANVDHLVKSLERGEMSRYEMFNLVVFAINYISSRFRRFSVFLIDHSDPERGDLHFATNNQGASPVSDVCTSFNWFPGADRCFFSSLQSCSQVICCVFWLRVSPKTQ
jgi:hypothetical protein